MHLLPAEDITNKNYITSPRWCVQLCFPDTVHLYSSFWIACKNIQFKKLTQFIVLSLAPFIIEF